MEGYIIPRASMSSSISVIIPLAVSGYRTWVLGEEWDLLLQCAQGACEIFQFPLPLTILHHEPKVFFSLVLCAVLSFFIIYFFVGCWERRFFNLSFLFPGDADVSKWGIKLLWMVRTELEGTYFASLPLAELCPYLENFGCIGSIAKGRGNLLIWIYCYTERMVDFVGISMGMNNNDPT